jgi:hypothetical protein
MARRADGEKGFFFFFFFFRSEEVGLDAASE